jgi:uncharacterized protein YkwD
MARFKFRRAPRLENLESRELLSAVPTSTPNDAEQYMLQLVNMARTNPQAAVSYLKAHITPDVQATINYYNVDLNATLSAIGSAKAQPPVAWNSDLAQSAMSHSQDMAQNNFQGHDSSNGTNPTQRMQGAGYSNPSSTGENVYAYATSVDQAMEAFLLDWGVSDDGHRQNIQQPNVNSQNAYRDVGIGVVSASGGSVGPMVVTQDYGSQPSEKAQVVGVAYNDTQGTGYYQVGEGDAGVTITAVNRATGQVSSTTTWATGGYELPLDNGSYRLIASVNGQVVGSQDITINGQNVEQDFNLQGTSQADSLSNAIAAAQPQPQAAAPAQTVVIPLTKAAPAASAPAPAPAPSAPAPSAPAPAPAPITWNWTSWSAKN